MTSEEEMNDFLERMVMAWREDSISQEFETFTKERLCPYSSPDYCKKVCPNEEFCTLRESYELNFERVN